MVAPRSRVLPVCMSTPHEFGRAAEDAAASFLEAAGYIILHRGFRFGHREIDLIVRAGSTVAFVEVKARRGSGFGHPLAAVTALKRREISIVANAWAAHHARPDDLLRFDAVAVELDPGSTVLRIEHTPDAWRL